MVKILYLIHLPPPTHGVSVICQQFYEYDFPGLPIRKIPVRLNLSRNMAELRKFSVTKIFRFIGICFKLSIKLVFFRPDLVYFSIMPVGKGFLKDTLLVILLKLFRVRIVYHLHNKGIPHYFDRNIYRLLYKFVFRNCSIIHLSEDLFNSEFEKLPKNRVQHYIVPNGIHSIKKYVRKKSTNKINILFFSNLIPEKGYVTSLNAIKKLVEEGYKNLKLIVAGTPSKLSEKVIFNFFDRNPQLKDFIEIQGTTYGEEKTKLFNSSDLFIFPSRFTQECMPLVIIEAMSVGMPVIASDIGAIPELIQNNKNGFLIPPGNVDALTEKIKLFMHDKKLIQQFGHESLSLFFSSFTQSHFFQHMETTLKKILC
jgi:glycosyltransferase involved in cell wall biosynthesis